VLEGKVTASLITGSLVVRVSDGSPGVEVGEANGSVIVGRTISRAGVSATGKPPMPMEVHSVKAGTSGPYSGRSGRDQSPFCRVTTRPAYTMGVGRITWVTLVEHVGWPSSSVVEARPTVP